MTNWHAAMAQASMTIDNTFGETLTITPCVEKPNFNSMPSPADAVSLVGVFRWRAKEDFKKEARPMGGISVETRQPIAEFDRASLPWAIRRGDQVTRCCDGTVFEVTAAMPDGVARITCRLVQLGLQHQ